MSRESEIAAEIEAILDAGDKVGIPPRAPVKLAYFTSDWRIVVSALQDAYRSNEFQRINGEKNTEIERLKSERDTALDKLAHAVRAQLPQPGESK